jgi:hypothetical protein
LNDWDAMGADTVESDVFANGAPQESQADRVLEQYKLVLGTAESLESRRQTLHTFFMSINSLFLAAVGVLGKESFDTPRLGIAVIVLGAVGVLLSASWLLQISAHGRLFSSKWEVINALEQVLPSQPFRAEYKSLRRRGYRPFTDIEKRIPWSFAGLYAVSVVAGSLLLADLI